MFNLFRDFFIHALSMFIPRSLSIYVVKFNTWGDNPNTIQKYPLPMCKVKHKKYLLSLFFQRSHQSRRVASSANGAASLPSGLRLPRPTWSERRHRWTTFPLERRSQKNSSSPVTSQRPLPTTMTKSVLKTRSSARLFQNDFL